MWATKSFDGFPSYFLHINYNKKKFFVHSISMLFEIKLQIIVYNLFKIQILNIHFIDKRTFNYSFSLL